MPPPAPADFSHGVDTLLRKVELSPYYPASHARLDAVPSCPELTRESPQHELLLPFPDNLGFNGNYNEPNMKPQNRSAIGVLLSTVVP
jgi:hypothetical protein